MSALRSLRSGSAIRLALVTLALATPSPARAVIGDALGLDPARDWRTLKTPHFRVSYPRELAPLAPRVLTLLEEAHAELSRRLYWEPARPTQVTLVDSSDAANGLTAPGLRIGIVLFLVPPDDWMSTAAYEDWIRLLVFHEYAHFVNIDPTRDVWKVGRWLFGDVYLPNALWPAWMTEGLATWIESRLTGAGRGRSSYYEMVLRTAVRDGTLDAGGKGITIDRLGGEWPGEPFGESAYLYGFHLWDRARRALKPDAKESADGGDDLGTPGSGAPGLPGEDAIGIVSYRSSRRLPFLINGNQENVTGQDWYALWDGFVEETRTRMRRRLDALAPLATPARPAFEADGARIGGCVSPDGRHLAYQRSDPHRRPGLVVAAAGAPGSVDDERLAVEKVFGSRCAFTPDSRHVLFSGLRPRNRFDPWSELGAYDLESGELRWLTDGARARDPDVSADGRWVVFARTQPREAALGIAVAPLRLGPDGALSLGEARVLYAAATWDRASSPRFLPRPPGLAEGEPPPVVFTLHRNGEVGERLLEADATGKTREWWAGGTMARHPAVDEGGAVWFTGEAGGVWNLYRLGAPGGAAERRTHVDGGLDFLMAAPRGGAREAWASIYTARGWQIGRATIASADLGPLAPTPGTGAAALPAPGVAAPGGAPTALAAAATESADAVTDTLFPRQWSPTYVQTGSSAYFGLSVLGFDALDRFVYGATALYDTYVGAADAAVLLGYRTGANLNLSLTGGLYTSATSTDALGQLATVTRAQAAALQLERPFRGQFSASAITFSAGVARETVTSPSLGTDLAVEPVIPELTLGGATDSRRATAWAIAPELGSGTAVAVRTLHPSGRPIAKVAVRSQLNQRLFGHWAFALSGTGVYSSQVRSDLSRSAVRTEGRGGGLLPPTGDALGNGFGTLPWRGYPRVRVDSRGVTRFAAELKFPLLRIFRGWGTNPIFAENLWGFGFGEVTSFEGLRQPTPSAPAYGGGLNLDLSLLQLPLRLTVQVHTGTEPAYGGATEVLGAVLVPGLSY